ncbi:transposase [Francisella philomiragia]|uniref:transposase n=1 Tax=Francisella philomiragia TaxID=28110 RepID=UPI00351287BD
MTNQTQYFRNRKKLRLKNYDYSSDGAYFVTICVNNRECLFGDIVGDEMILNDAGLMLQNCYLELQNKFENMQCGEFVVMPNHFHCVIHLYNKINVGANPCSCTNEGAAQKRADIESAPTNNTVGVESISTRVSLPRIIQTFKRQTTIEYIDGVKTKNWQPFDKRLWQRNYYEHIIRNEQSYFEICQYIRDNPQKLIMDSLNPDFDK